MGVLEQFECVIVVMYVVVDVSRYTSNSEPPK